jgi:flagellar biosynthesis GTPase FlhF
MKTSTLLAIGAVGALILLAKSRKSGLGEADMLLPPPGRTVTASGQVLGSLGAFSIGQHSTATKLSVGQTKVEGDTCYIVRPGRPASFTRDKNGPRSTPAGDPFWEYDAAATEALRARQAETRRIETEALAQKAVNATIAAIQKRAEDEMAAQAKAEQERQAAAQKAEQDRQAAAVKVTQEQATLAAAAKPIVHQQTNYDAAKRAYDAEAAAREQASMSQATNDTGYGATQQVTEEGAPQMPERIASVQTPAAIMLPEAKAAAPSGNTKVGLLVGGGVLAAIAAAIAS